MDEHDEALSALIEAKAACTDACADEAVHAEHREALEQAYARYAAASRAQAALVPAGPEEPVGVVTVSSNGEVA